MGQHIKNSTRTARRLQRNTTRMESTQLRLVVSCAMFMRKLSGSIAVRLAANASTTLTGSGVTRSSRRRRTEHMLRAEDNLEFFINTIKLNAHGEAYLAAWRSIRRQDGTLDVRPSMCKTFSMRTRCGYPSLAYAHHSRGGIRVQVAT